MSTLVENRYDLTAPQTFRSVRLHEMWAQLRRDAPVSWQPHGDTGFWSVTRYADVVAVYKDRERFTSGRGTVLDVLLAGDDPAGGRMLAVTDGARHRAIRKVMTRFFTPRALAPIEPAIAQRTRSVVREAVERGTVDFSTEVADRLPIEAICDLMAIPAADRPHLLACTKAALSADDEDADELDALAARGELLMYLADLVAQRRESPGDDIVSALTTAEVDSEPLDDDDLALNCYSLIIGGDESTRMSAVCGTLELARHPQEWRRVQEAASLDTCVDEMVRWTTPSMHFARTATTDVELAGRTVRAGDIVALWNTSANFDETVFDDPGRFDALREPNEHVAFGQGGHYCVGAVMAKLELRCLLHALRDEVAALEVAGEPDQVWSNFLFGYSSAPLHLTPH